MVWLVKQGWHPTSASMQQIWSMSPWTSGAGLLREQVKGAGRPDSMPLMRSDRLLLWQAKQEGHLAAIAQQEAAETTAMTM